MDDSLIGIPFNILHIRSGELPIIYKRGEEIGHGGFAKVFKAVNKNTGEEVAIKVTSRNKLKKPRSEQKHKAEVAIQMSLNHPNIVKALDFFSDQFFTYLVLELCPGGSLKGLVRQKTKLSEVETVKYLIDILNGLSYLHDNRIIHRDLKLDNFLLDKDGNVKIADFGLSTKLTYDDERKHSVCGTPNYISPELLMNAKQGISYEVDIWAIGVSAYAMLTGSLPFQTKHTKDTYEKIKNCSYTFPSDCDISHGAKSFIQSILQLDPEMRPTALELQYCNWIQSRKKSIKKEVNLSSNTVSTTYDKPKYEYAKINENNEVKVNIIQETPVHNVNLYPSNSNHIATHIPLDIKNSIILKQQAELDKIKEAIAITKKNNELFMNNLYGHSNNNENHQPNDNVESVKAMPENKTEKYELKTRFTSNKEPNIEPHFETIQSNKEKSQEILPSKVEQKIEVEHDHPKKNESERVQMPKYMVSRFCDHNGLGYLLMNGCVGACFNDGTRMVFDPHQTFIQYWEEYQDPAPRILEIDGNIEFKKITLLKKFSSSLKKSSSMFQVPDEPFDRNTPMLHVKYWMRTNEVTLFRMNNRNIQLNFVDRKKLIIFWNIRKLMSVSTIYDYGELHKLHDVSKRPDGDDEKRRLELAKHLLSIMSRGNDQ